MYSTQIKIHDDEEYRLELYITQGGVECFDDDSMKVSVNPLPNIVLGPDESVCCDYGAINLNFKLTTPVVTLPPAPGVVLLLRVLSLIMNLILMPVAD